MAEHNSIWEALGFRKASGVGYSNGSYQCSVVKWAFENAWAAN